MYHSFSSGVKYVVHVDGITHAQVNTQRFYEVAEKKDGIVQATLPSHQVFDAYMTEIRRFIGEDWTPLRIAKDGCGLTVSNTVAELAQIYAGLVR